MRYPEHLGRWLPIVAVLLLCAAVTWPSAIRADHESTTTATFAPVDESATPNGTGSGTIDYHGGPEPESRWTATFAFSGLQAGATYVVAVQGRTGEDGSAEARAFSEICRFAAAADGSGGCWFYFVGLRRLATMEVRAGELDGPAVLASTKGDGPGSMARETNAYSLALTATPQASPPSGTPAP